MGEDRFVMIGASCANLLFVVYVERGPTLRIISARKASKDEKKVYQRRRRRRVAADKVSARQFEARARRETSAMGTWAHSARLPAERYGIPLGTLRDSEQGRAEPDATARTYLKVIKADPKKVAKIYEAA